MPNATRRRASQATRQKNRGGRSASQDGMSPVTCCPPLFRCVGVGGIVTPTTLLWGKQMRNAQIRLRWGVAWLGKRRIPCRVAASSH